ncbi:hypothetical protein BDQ17DRAFT_1426044 [Cyathus striatus]|nr:hypothetical protein BDQ17DRAFT_1426044 [Cyathus striatus]
MSRNPTLFQLYDNTPPTPPPTPPASPSTPSTVPVPPMMPNDANYTTNGPHTQLDHLIPSTETITRGPDTDNTDTCPSVLALNGTFQTIRDNETRETLMHDRQPTTATSPTERTQCNIAGWDMAVMINLGLRDIAQMVAVQKDIYAGKRDCNGYLIGGGPDDILDSLRETTREEGNEEEPEKLRGRDNSR